MNLDLPSGRPRVGLVSGIVPALGGLLLASAATADFTLQEFGFPGSSFNICYDLAIGDVTGDGVAEIVFSRHPLGFGVFGGFISMVSVDDPGTVEVIVPASSGKYSGVTLVDVDGDGDLDLLTRYTTESIFIDCDDPPDCTRFTEFYDRLIRLHVYLNDGNGGFTLDSTPFLTFCSRPFDPPKAIEGRRIATGDFDGDGDVDVVVPLDCKTFRLRNDGSGSFGFVSSLAGSAEQAIACDLDGDGDPDLVTIEGDFVGSGADTIRRFRNDGGTLVDLGTSLIGADELFTIDVADLDGDGLPEIVMADNTGVMGPSKVVVLPNTGGMTFGPQQDFPLPGSCRHVKVGNLGFGNGTTPSIVVTQGTGANQGVFIFAPDGEVQGTFSSPGGNRPWTLGVGDLDADGLDEIVFTDRDTGIYTFADRPAAPPAIPGDANGDGFVNLGDLLAVLAAWGPCDDGTPCLTDFDDDGATGLSDVLQVLANFS